jgi:hypothetical protein
MNNFPVLISAIGSIVASIVAIVSIFIATKNYKLSKNKMISDIFPRSRIQWITDVREKIFIFIDSYFEEQNYEPSERRKLQKTKLKIELFLNYSYENENYINLKKILCEYLEEKDVIKDHSPLIIATQKMFDSVFRRAKFEAGITPKDDKIIRDEFSK